MNFDDYKWFVLIHEFNGDTIEQFNIFHSMNFTRCLERSLKHYTDFKTFKEDLRGDLFYAFGSKCEYEIMCSGLVSLHENETKIDVYTQVLPNLDILANYIIDKFNEKKRKKLIK